MKISTRGRYALRMMMDIAIYGSENPVRIKDIAQREQISEKYLEQIISTLNKSGFVKSSRGPRGGYRLAYAPEEYTTGMILRTVEGSLAPVECLDGGGSGCEKRDICSTLRLWKMINEAVQSVVNSVTLADLVKWHYELSERRGDISDCG